MTIYEALTLIAEFVMVFLATLTLIISIVVFTHRKK